MTSNSSYGENPFLKNISINNYNSGYNPYNNNINAGALAHKDATPSTQRSAAVVIDTSDIDYSEPDFYYQPQIVSWYGRLGRLRFLTYRAFVWQIFTILFLIFFSNLENMNPFMTPLALIVGFAVGLVFWLADITLVKRRLNDLDSSGWYYVLTLVPIINIMFELYLLFFPGTETSNRWGPPPLPENRMLMIFSLAFVFVTFLLTSKSFFTQLEKINQAQNGLVYEQTLAEE